MAILTDKKYITRTRKATEDKIHTMSLDEEIKTPVKKERKDIMKENNEVLINVGSKTRTAEDLLIIIPERYREKIEKIKFKDFEELSKALMFMNCAEEARAYNNEFLERANELGFDWFVKNRAI